MLGRASILFTPPSKSRGLVFRVRVPGVVLEFVRWREGIGSAGWTLNVFIPVAQVCVLTLHHGGLCRVDAVGDNETCGENVNGVVLVAEVGRNRRNS